jgi:hypothetical protein
MQRTPITCPKCSAVFHVETETRRRPKPPAPEPVKKRVVEPADADVAVADDDVSVEPGAGDEVIEDASDLGEDEEYEVDEAADEEPA